jgi:hypothetical protein
VERSYYKYGESGQIFFIRFSWNSTGTLLQCILLSSSVCSSVCSSMLCIPLKPHKHGRIARSCTRKFCLFQQNLSIIFFLQNVSSNWRSSFQCHHSLSDISLIVCLSHLSFFRVSIEILKADISFSFQLEWSGNPKCHSSCALSSSSAFSKFST